MVKNTQIPLSKLKKTGRQAIIEQFIADGITHMFGNPGTVEQGFLYTSGCYPEFKYILTLQESIAVAIADGYARATRKPTVVQLHNSVGLGNGIGMIYQAKRGHSPLIIIAGEAGIKYDALDAVGSADVVSIARPVTKWATRVVHESSLLRVIRRAIKIATTPPMGPVFISLPMDILDAPNKEEISPTSRLMSCSSPDSTCLKSVADILTSAVRPMIIMGDGISFSNAQNELVKIAELIGAEVWGADSSEVNFRASHPQFRGLLGHVFGQFSKTVTRRADVVLICGTYVFPEVFPVLEKAFATNAKVIHIDLDSYEIAKNFPVNIGIVGDPKTTLVVLSELIAQTISTKQKDNALKRVEKLKKMKDEETANYIQKDNQLRGSSPLRAFEFMEALAKNIPKDTIIFDEALTTSPELNRYIQADIPGNFFQTRGGSLGVGIPGAIGIKLANPDKTVIGFSGDGGSMYTIQALWTAAHYNIGAKFVICNNHSYSLLKLNIIQYWRHIGVRNRNFPDFFSIKDPEIRFDSLSIAMGVPAVRVQNSKEIEPAIRKLLETGEPFLIDLVVGENLPN